MRYTDLPTGVTQEHQTWWEAALRDIDGKPERVPQAEALALAEALGVDVGGIAADDVAAFRFPTISRAMLSARANVEAHGHDLLTIVEDPAGGVIEIIDLRPAKARMTSKKEQVPA